MGTDTELLRSYAHDRSESAFSELVHRHIDMVYSAALRETRGNASLAEDITQSVFAELARKASKLERHPALAGWLFICVRLMAANVRRAEQRRHRRELEAQTMNELLSSDSPDSVWRQIQPAVDDAMHELSETDRAAVVLRYFEERPLKEVGLALGINENAARMRVDRALEKLQALLAKRGVTSTTSGLAAAITAEAALSAPAGLASSVAAGALAATATATSTPIAALNLMSMTKVKASLLSAILVAGLATPLVIRHQARVNLREKGEASQQQPNDELTYLRAENEKLSNLVAQANSSQSLSKDQLSELLKLRAEVSRLRGDSQELARLKAAKEGTDQGSQLIRVTPFPPGDMAGRDLARMRTRLNLTSEQVQALRELLLKKAEASYPGTQLPSAERAAELSKSAARAEDQIRSLLTPEQQVAYAELQRDDRAVQARVSANFELLQIQNLLGLTQEQQGLVAAALYEHHVRQMSGDLLTGSEAAFERTTDPMKVMQGRFEQKLKALETLLTPSQLEAYRQDLESQLAAARWQ